MKLNPSDLGTVLEERQKIKIDDFVRSVNAELKRQMLKAQLAILDTPIDLTTTKTRFGGQKYWFVCPTCSKRVGTLFLSLNDKRFHCRRCLRLLYYQQRYKDELHMD